MIWAKTASALLFMAVALGAFGSHAFKAKLSEHYMDVYKTAVLYHFIHALGLFAVSWLSTQLSDPKIHTSGILLLTGIFLFSGSLYVLCLTGQKWLGAIAPVGGLALLAGWFLLFISIKL